MSHYEKRIARENIYTGTVIRVFRDTVELENGKTACREVVAHNGGACVVALTNQQEVYLVQQFRYAFGQALLELPAGKLEPGEAPLECAARELREECGLTAGRFVDIHPIYPSVGYDTEIIYLYLATELTVGSACPDEDEFLSVIKMPLSEAVDLVMKGEIQDGKTVAGLLKAYQLVKE